MLIINTAAAAGAAAFGRPQMQTFYSIFFSKAVLLISSVQAPPSRRKLHASLLKALPCSRVETYSSMWLWSGYLDGLDE